MTPPTMGEEHLLLFISLMIPLLFFVNVMKQNIILPTAHAIHIRYMTEQKSRKKNLSIFLRVSTISTTQERIYLYHESSSLYSHPRSNIILKHSTINHLQKGKSKLQSLTRQAKANIISSNTPVR